MCGQVRSLALGVELDPPDVSMGSLVAGVRLVLALDQLYAVESWAVEFNSRSTAQVMAQLERAQRGREELGELLRGELRQLEIRVRQRSNSHGYESKCHAANSVWSGLRHL